ncbi:argininosuccinate lyase [Jannaschia marina]|uniref:argininosuccinate lyase n=1 Tax=Jannaschia marina TaxID=2741674 RepID=UPI0015C88D8E|nr:argininosuccinate lyase [Jannaschia marina]
MTRALTALVLTALLAACGVDGEPVPPSEAAAEQTSGPGLTISGSAEVGIRRTF